MCWEGRGRLQNEGSDGDSQPREGTSADFVSYISITPGVGKHGRHVAGTLLRGNIMYKYRCVLVEFPWRG